MASNVANIEAGIINGENTLHSEKKSLEAGVNSNTLTIDSENGSYHDPSPLDLKVVKKLRLKIDLILLPTLALMYTFKSVISPSTVQCRTNRIPSVP